MKEDVRQEGSLIKLKLAGPTDDRWIGIIPKYFAIVRASVAFDTGIPFPEKVYSIELAGNFTIRISRAAETVYPTLFFSLSFPPFFRFFFCYRSQYLVAGFSTMQQVRNEFHRFSPAAMYWDKPRNAKKYSTKNGREERWDRVCEWNNRNKRKLPFHATGNESQVRPGVTEEQASRASCVFFPLFYFSMATRRWFNDTSLYNVAVRLRYK